jgi:hypothetical protein
MPTKTRIKIGDFFTVENLNDSDIWQIFKPNGKRPLRRYTSKRQAIGQAQTWAWAAALQREPCVSESSSAF